MTWLHLVIYVPHNSNSISVTKNLPFIVAENIITGIFDPQDLPEDARALWDRLIGIESFDNYSETFMRILNTNYFIIGSYLNPEGWILSYWAKKNKFAIRSFGTYFKVYRVDDLFSAAEMIIEG